MNLKVEQRDWRNSLKIEAQVDDQSVEYLQIKARGYENIEERVIEEEIVRTEPHTHDVSYYGCCLEGSFRIDQTVYYPGDFFEVPAGVEHKEVTAKGTKIIIGSK